MAKRRYGSGGGWIKLVAILVIVGIAFGGFLSWLYWDNVSAFLEDTKSRVEDKLTDDETPSDENGGGSENETPNDGTGENPGENETPVCEHLNVEEIERIEPTCTKNGKTEGTICTDCGEILIAREEIMAHGHAESTFATAFPTCTEDGRGFTVCTTCNEKIADDVVIPATGHNFVDGVCTNFNCGATE